MCPAPSREEIVSRIHKVRSDDAINNPPPAPEQKAFVQQFILTALGNTELNKAITTVNAKSLNGTGISGDDTWELRNFTYKTRHVEQFERIAGKLREVNQALQLEQPIPPEKRLTLREYGLIADMAKSFSVLDKLNSAGILEGNERLMSLYENAKIAKTFVTKLEKEYKASMEVEPGTIAFDNTRKKSDVKGMTMSFYDSLVDKTVTKYTHASKIYVGASAPPASAAASSAATPAALADEVKISHINPGYESLSFPMNEFLYADTYRIDLTKLISPQDQKILKDNCVLQKMVNNDRQG